MTVRTGLPVIFVRLRQQRHTATRLTALISVDTRQRTARTVMLAPAATTPPEPYLTHTATPSRVHKIMLMLNVVIELTVYKGYFFYLK